MHGEVEAIGYGSANRLAARLAARAVFEAVKRGYPFRFKIHGSLVFVERPGTKACGLLVARPLYELPNTSRVTGAVLDVPFSFNPLAPVIARVEGQRVLVFPEAVPSAVAQLPPLSSRVEADVWSRRLLLYPRLRLATPPSWLQPVQRKLEEEYGVKLLVGFLHETSDYALLDTEGRVYAWCNMLSHECSPTPPQVAYQGFTIEYPL